MSDLILQPTTTAQWLALVSEAEQATGRWLDEESESYLVFLLIRHTDDRQLITQIVGQGYLQSQNLPPNQRQQQLRGVGDHCLLFSGLFPKVAEKRLVKVSYFVALGRTAYDQLSGMVDRHSDRLYGRLAQTFVGIMDVLHAMRGLSGEPVLDPLAAAELWADTGSQSAYQAMELNEGSLPVARSQQSRRSH